MVYASKLRVKHTLLTICLSATLFAPSIIANAKVTLTFTHYLAPEYIDGIIADFNAKNPEIEVQGVRCGFRDCHQKLTSALAVGEGAADVSTVSTIFLGTFINSGGLSNLSEAPFNIDKTNWQFDPSMISLSSNAENQIFGVPFDTGPVIMVYRNDMVEKANTSIEAITKDWDSFIAFGEKLKAEQGAFLVPAATSLINPLVVGLNSESGKAVYTKDGKPNLNTPEIKQLISLSKTLYDKGLAASLDGATNSQEYITLYRQGKLFSDIDGPWDEGRVAQELDPDGAKAGLWRVTGLPNGVKVNAGGTVFAIPAQTKHPEESWKFVQHLMERTAVIDAAKVAGTLPARIDVYNDEFFDKPSEILGGQHSMRYYATLVPDLKPVLASPEDKIANEILQDAVKKILTQNADIDATLNEANTLLERRMRTL